MKKRLMKGRYPDLLKRAREEGFKGVAEAINYYGPELFREKYIGPVGQKI